MQPAVDADLRAIRESLERLAVEHRLSSAAVATLNEVERSLRRLERTWARVLPYLVAENAATAALLKELAPLVPAPLRDDIASSERVPAPVADPRALDAVHANELNGELRGLLARVIAALPGDQAGSDARERTREHLQDMLRLRPW